MTLAMNFEKVKNGFIDFLLLDEHGKPFIVLEAKSEDKDPLVGKEQARAYAKSNFVKYVILSNGNIHYFWNIYKGNPQIILSFPTYESVRESKALNADPSRLYNEEITSDYIAVVREPRYVEAPEYKNPDTTGAVSKRPWFTDDAQIPGQRHQSPPAICERRKSTLSL